MKNTVVGKVLDNYRILQNIGRGGMGFVFKALNIKLNKIVAIKMIAPALAMNDNFMRRFEDEAKALAKLDMISAATATMLTSSWSMWRV